MTQLILIAVNLILIMAGRYTGGYVIEPKIGIHNNVIVLDFRNLYPSIIVTHNIDPTTLNKKDCKKKVKVPGFERWFCQDKVAPVPKRIKKILEERWKLKKQLKKKYYPKLAKKEQQLKLAANIAYGYFGYAESPYYSIECAESISAFGRHYIQKVIKDAGKAGLNVIYGDTDSVFITGSTSKTKQFLDKTNNSLPGIIKLEFRGIYKKGLFVSTKGGKGAKKKYALIDKKGELMIRGFETRREDWCQLAKETQKKILNYVLLEKNKEAIVYTRTIVKKLKDKKVKLSDLVLTVQLTKSVEKYKVSSAHVEVAKKMDRVKEGTMIRFIIAKGNGPIFKRAKPINKARISDIDEDYYINKQVIPAAMRVLSIFGVKENELK